MIKERKNLKEYSFVILIFAALSLVRLIIDACADGFSTAIVPIEGATEEMVKTAVIIAFVLALLLLIPDVYVGFKGLKEAQNPTGARAHIVWALVLSIIYLIATISSVVEIAKGFDVDKLIKVLNVAVDTALFYAYYLTAKKVANKK